ncbi:unnamed protein product, partial [Symbiodinium sp. CCMP2456]
MPRCSFSLPCRSLLFWASTLASFPTLEAHTEPRKRAFNRACRRAAASPLLGTNYRGRWCSVKDLLGKRRTPPAQVRASRHTLPIQSNDSARLKLVTYNVGGLSQVAYAELLQFLQGLPEPHRPDLVLLQETHWKEDSEFDTPGWRVISSSTKSPQAGGVAVLISQSLCDAGDILHTSPVPGRVQHVRLTLDGAIVDVVNIYQKIMTTSLAPAEKGSVPGTTARTIRREVWSSIQRLLRSLPSRHVVIMAGDFNTPLLPMAKRVGARASFCHATRPQDVNELADIIADHDLLHLNSWTRFAKPTYRNGSHFSLIDHIFVRKVASISRSVSAVACQMFVNLLDLVAPDLVFSLAKYSINVLFHGRHHRFRKAHRAFRRATRDAKVAWLRTQVACMEQSARKGDTRALFQLASRICPKQRRKTLQLRGAQGQILSHPEQVEVLRSFYTDLYTSGHQDSPSLSDPLRSDCCDGLFACLNPELVTPALRRLSPHKAAPAHLAHTSIWVACSAQLGPWLANTLRKATSIPQLWKDTWLSLLPKVSAPTLPRQLRPLGISEISGRVVCGLIQHQLRPHVMAFLSQHPQYAYLVDRATDQALIRVLLHCKAFDRLEWPLISDSLKEAGVPSDLYHLIIRECGKDAAS